MKIDKFYSVDKPVERNYFLRERNTFIPTINSTYPQKWV